MHVTQISRSFRPFTCSISSSSFLPIGCRVWGACDYAPSSDAWIVVRSRPLDTRGCRVDSARQCAAVYRPAMATQLRIGDSRTRHFLMPAADVGHDDGASAAAAAVVVSDLGRNLQWHNTECAALHSLQDNNLFYKKKYHKTYIQSQIKRC